MKRRLYVGAFVFVAIFSPWACDVRPTVETDAFAEDYVQSVYEGSNFFRQYTADDQEDLVEKMRSRMTKDFKIRRHDRLLNTLEYQVDFSNGNRGMVHIVVYEGQVVEASITVLNPN